MEEDLGTDIVDGKIINWNNLTVEELKKMKSQYEEKERQILKKIDKELNKEDDDNIK